MNERIRELAEQAILQCVDENGFLGKDKSIRINPDNYVDQAMVQEFIEKFAELIVKECMSINTQRLFSDYEGDTHRVAHNNALWCAWGDMREHFGVEE